ncbi:MAG: hypothetical protein N2654_00750 [Deltaproteobacteria bacterium]|nr:hypothetical protein [Deltaproteobacteria bacterium]
MRFELPKPKELFLLLSDEKLNNLSKKIFKVATISAGFVLVFGIFFVIFSAYRELKSFNEKISLLKKTEPKVQKINYFKRVNLKQIEQQKLFGNLVPSTSLRIEAPKAVEKPKYSLIATFIQRQKKFAILENGGTRVQDAFEEGEKVFDQATLVKVMAGKVVLKWSDGTEETLVLDESYKGAQEGSVSVAGVETTKRISLSRTTLNEFLDDVSVFATQARVVPFFQDGRPVGLRLFGITPGGVYQFLGFENGDIVKSVEGSSILNLADFTNLVRQLKEKSRISVLIERNRSNVEIIYDIS